VTVGTGGGFYAGLNSGAKLFGSMHAQTNFYGAVSSMRQTSTALGALNANDLSSAKNSLELTLDTALIDFARYADAIAYQQCEPKVAEAVAEARAYRAVRAGPMQATSAKSMVEKALAYCRAQDAPQ
jgi:hypothetical protein